MYAKWFLAVEYLLLAPFVSKGVIANIERELLYWPMASTCTKHARER